MTAKHIRSSATRRQVGTGALRQGGSAHLCRVVGDQQRVTAEPPELVGEQEAAASSSKAAPARRGQVGVSPEEGRRSGERGSVAAETKEAHRVQSESLATTTPPAPTPPPPPPPSGAPLAWSIISRSCKPNTAHQHVAAGTSPPPSPPPRQQRRRRQESPPARSWTQERRRGRVPCGQAQRPAGAEGSSRQPPDG